MACCGSPCEAGRCGNEPEFIVQWVEPDDEEYEVVACEAHVADVADEVADGLQRVIPISTATDAFDAWCRANGEHVTDSDGVVLEVASR